MALMTKSTAYTRMFLMVLTSDHVSAATGKTVTVTLSKAGGSFGAPSGGGTATEVASGWYKIALSTTDTNTAGDLIIHCSASLCDDTDVQDQVTSIDIVGTAISVAKNTALASYAFPMYDSGTGLPKTGVTVTAQRSIDGAAFGSCANSVSELSNGIYLISLAAADLNGRMITLRFSATGALDMIDRIITEGP